MGGPPRGGERRLPRMGMGGILGWKGGMPGDPISGGQRGSACCARRQAGRQAGDFPGPGSMYGMDTEYQKPSTQQRDNLHWGKPLYGDLLSKNRWWAITSDASGFMDHEGGRGAKGWKGYPSGLGLLDLVASGGWMCGWPEIVCMRSVASYSPGGGVIEPASRS